MLSGGLPDGPPWTSVSGVSPTITASLAGTTGRRTHARRSGVRLVAAGGLGVHQEVEAQVVAVQAPHQVVVIAVGDYCQPEVAGQRPHRVRHLREDHRRRVHVRVRIGELPGRRFAAERREQPAAAASPATQRLPGTVDVRAVINTNDVDGSSGPIDAVNHSVSSAAGGVIATQLAGEGLADPVRVVEQRTGQEFGDRCRDRERQAAGRPFNEHTASRGRQR